MENDLITVLDVENVTFPRAIRGYQQESVEDFLDHVADTLQVYSERQAFLEQEIRRLRESLNEYDSLKDSLQEALLMAQRSSEQRISSSQKEADAVVAEARSKAEAMIAEARSVKISIQRECDEVSKMRELFLAEFRAMLTRFTSRAESPPRFYLEGDDS